MADEHEILERHLRERGYRMTGPRATVLRAFLSIERHVTADSLLAASRRLDPGIGQATVFRTLRLLVEAGLARDSGVERGARTWEHAYRHEHHDHLRCLGCGAIVEFRDDRIERLQEELYARYGFEPAGHRFELYGYCAKCGGPK